jgi:type IV pilus assembly protein PilF
MTLRLLWTVLVLALGACATTGGATGGSPSKSEAAARINLQLGIGYLQEGNLAIAKEKLDRARSQDPHNPEIHGAMALLDQRLGKDKEADKEFRTALELAPHDPAMLNNYAVFLCSHERADEGVRYFEQAASRRRSTRPRIWTFSSRSWPMRDFASMCFC